MSYRILFFLIVILYTAPGLMAQSHGDVSKKERSIPSYLDATELKSARLYQKVLPSVVTIFTKSNNFTSEGAVQNQGLGSGVLISHDCYILTAAHVVDGSSQITVKTQDGKNRKANVLFSDKTTDLALLQLDVLDSSLPHAKLGDSDNLAVGQRVYAVGSPYGLENSFSAGIISAFRGFNQLYDGTVNLEFIQTDAAINSGNSGGPLFNSQGEVIGIASSILTVSGGFQGIGMVVAINTAKDLLAFEDRPWIGAESVLLSQEQFKSIFNLDLQGGLLIQHVSPNSPAARAGLRGGYIKSQLGGRDILFGGDIILQIQDQPTCHGDCLEALKDQVSDMNKLKITYLREGKVYSATLDITDTRKNFLALN